MPADQPSLRDAVRQQVRDLLRETAAVAPAGVAPAGVAPAAAPVAPAAAPGPGPGAADPKRIAIGSDHGAFALKQALVRYLRGDLGFTVDDCGTDSTAAVDYPDIAVAVAHAVTSGRASRGILLDGAGIGSTMAANKIPGVRAALCHDLMTVRNSREHNNANLLVLGSNCVSRATARRMVAVWLSTPFAGGRHQMRVAKIDALDRR